MPSLVRLYIRHCLIGFGLSAVFVGSLFAFDVANLWSLIRNSDIGWIAALMLFMGNGIVFAGVQFGITVMRMGEEQDRGPRGNAPEPVLAPVPVRVSTAHGPR